jgi:hypothetical protein
MPVIHIEYDENNITEADARKLAEASHKLVSSITDIEDVPVYANSSQIRVAVSPIEIFVRLSAHKIDDPDKLTAELKSAFSEWSKKEQFNHPINLTLIPMDWKIEIGI